MIDDTTTLSPEETGNISEASPGAAPPINGRAKTPTGTKAKPAKTPDPNPGPEALVPDDDTPLTAIPDPFDLDKHRRNPNKQIVGREKILSKVAVDKPRKGEFFRTFPDEKFWYEAYILQLEDGTAIHLLTPEVYEMLEDQSEDTIKAVTLCLYVTKSGRVGFWPLIETPEGQDQNSWHASAWAACRAAQTGWVRIKSNRPNGCYDIKKSLQNDEAPAPPKENMSQLMHLAFKGCIISSLNHSVLRKLEVDEE